MGGKESRPPSPPPPEERIVYRDRPTPPPPPTPPNPLLDEPWRPIDWSNANKKRLLQKIEKYTPRHGEKHLRILVYGPVGAGKSSFINSVTSTLYGRMSYGAEANTADSASRSFTLKYETHRIYKDEGYSDECYPFVFNDIMGIEGGDKIGIHPQDIISALKGHVKEGYKFNPMSPLVEGDNYYNPNPTIDDKVHVLVLMLPANSSAIDESMIKKLKEVRGAAADLGIPQLAVGTHIDKSCPEVNKDLRNIYRSKSLENKMKEFSHAVGIPVNGIMCVKNYSKEMDNVDDVDILLLITLRHMIDTARDFVRKIARKTTN